MSIDLEKLETLLKKGRDNEMERGDLEEKEGRSGQAKLHYGRAGALDAVLEYLHSYPAKLEHLAK